MQPLNLFKYDNDERFSYTENLNRAVKYHTLVIVNLLLIALAIISFILRIAGGESLAEHTLIILAVVILSINLTLLVVWNRIRLPNIILNSLLVIIIPLRAIDLNGLETPALMIYILHAMLVYVLFDRKFIAHLIMSLNAFVMFGFIMHEYLSGVEFIIVFRGIGVLLLMLISAMVMNIFLDMRDKLFETIKRQEVSDTENLILKHLSQEIMTSLNIATHYVDKLQQSQDPHVKENADFIQEQCKSIEFTLEQMNDLQTNHDLSQILAKSNNTFGVKKD